MLPPFRERLAEVPLGLDHPYWIEDPDFDIEYHVRELALPKPGDDQQARRAGRAHPRARARSCAPALELYVIQGLRGRSASRSSPRCITPPIDGMSGAEILGVLLDPSPEAARCRRRPTGGRRRLRPDSSRCSSAACWGCRASSCAR